MSQKLGLHALVSSGQTHSMDSGGERVSTVRVIQFRRGDTAQRVSEVIRSEQKTGTLELNYSQGTLCAITWKENL